MPWEFLTFTVPAALAPAFVLLWIFHTMDRFPEPTSVVLKTFGLGVACVIPAVILAVPLSVYFHMLDLRNPFVFGLMQAFLCAAIPEELAKYLLPMRYAMRQSAFDEPMDGVVYGVAGSLGFAALENIMYVAGGGLPLAIARAITAVPGHALFGAIMGFYVGQARLRPSERSSLMFKAVAIPIILHGLYDFPLMTVSAMSDGGQLTDGQVSLAMFLFFCSMAVLFVGLIWAFALAYKLRKQQFEETGR